jgi:uncharacterized RDD family membrane protein YckC
MNAIAPASAPARGPQFDNRRVLAGLIDVLIVAAVALVVGVVAGVVGGEASETTPALEAVILGWALFYYFALESGAGQTVGKRVMGLRVTMADGSPADMRAIAVRTVLRVIDGIAFYVVGLIVMLATGQRRQRLGDLAAGTIVTSADAASAPMARPAADAQSAVVLPPVADPSVFDPQTPESLGGSVDAPAPIVEPFPDLPPLEATAPVVEPAPVEPPAPVVEPDVPAAEQSDVPELKPFDPFSPAEPEAAVEPMTAPDLGAPSAPAVETPVMEIDSAPVEESEPAMEIESGPAAAVPAVEDEPVVESPAAPAEEAAPTTDWSIPAPQQTPPADEPTAEADEDSVRVRSVETVSAIDLVMGEVEEDEAAGSTPTA